jgi:hypothetical protein
MHGFLIYLMNIIKDNRTPIFLLGMGFEAAGLTIQSALGYPMIPVADAIITFAMAAGIIWYVRREERSVQ